MLASKNTLKQPDGLPTIHTPILTHVGDSALLLTPGQGNFNPGIQTRLLALARRLYEAPLREIFTEVVPGVNNLLVLFDIRRTSANEANCRLLDLWEDCDTTDTLERDDIEIPVVYGGSEGEDLVMLAQAAGMNIPDYVECHSSSIYTVACIGAYPGFAFLSGLPAELCISRRATPRLKVPKGAVIVGGAQAGVMPCTAPSGWHILGMTDTPMFDLGKESPCLVQPGDRVRFTIQRIEHD